MIYLLIMVPFVAAIWIVAILEIQSAITVIRENKKIEDLIKTNKLLFEQRSARAMANGAIVYDAIRDYFLTEKGEIFDEWRKD